MTKKTTNEARRAGWMLEFEAAVLQRDQGHAGRICWNTAQFYYSWGYDHREAAIRYVKNNTPEATPCQS